MLFRAMERINMKRGIIVLALASVALGANAQTLSEDFVNVPNLFASGWQTPIGSTTWFRKH